MISKIIESPKSITFLGLILGIIVAGIALVIIILKSKRDVTLKHGNSEFSLKSSSPENRGKEGKAVTKKESKNASGFDLEKLTLHRFFTTVIVQYTTENSLFKLYDETIRLGIIKDSEDIANFKKFIAGKYLNLCLFKTLGEYIKKWVYDIVNEMSEAKDQSKIPESFFSISKYITKYKNDAYNEGKQVKFKYNGKLFNRIPVNFMTRFNKWSDTNMVRVFDMISDVLYSAQENWFAKTIELLDLFEVIFIMLHDQMDSTLIILNGEIADFIKKLKSDMDEE
jgi:hypothetical protein